ncbi:DUF1428 domain-containing protein [Streptomyces sp. HB132]|uniref:DUF1428 domain-containing protein n=1 Tax=Streptomyces sp. HB132 TaxID=767388 RepID=UPI00196137C3|nr:DUF1428 family protein [Streptomyces sp. HB132]MBM7442443.1 uncharacterized protein YbaA (DUF1428 family) [Streptomyces sp. HB132]
MTFADITIVPVRSDRKAAYLAFSRRMADVYREYGATRITDHWQSGTPVSQDDFHADGVSYGPGELRGLASMMGASDLESVVVTITEWPSRDVRDRGSAAATKDPRVLATLDEDPVFDGRRLVAESFEIAMSLPDER